MREKYIDEAVGLYFIFGESPDGQYADVHTNNAKVGDVFTHLPKRVAERVCELQHEFREKLYEILCDETL